MKDNVKLDVAIEIVSSKLAEANKINREVPEYFVPISATGSNPVTPLVMQEAVDRGYNFVFDGTEYCHKQKLTKYRSWKVSYDKLNKRWNLWREMIRIHKIDRRQI
ncbi:MAG: hypothetical protein Q4C11_02965 [Clostridium sp.]|nr:hypothetical protein [Clostridium sp.]